MSQVWILLLRGVNVGGVKLPMAPFRAMLEDLGCQSVATYIQSGNAVFAGSVGVEAIAAGLRARFGLSPALFLYRLEDFEAILSACPYQAEGAAEGALVHVVFHRAQLGPGLAAHQAAGEAFAEGQGALYLHLPHGMGRSDLAQNLPRHLKGDQSARNWRTCLALQDLGRALRGLTQG